MAAWNLAKRGDPNAAWRSMLQPESLSPEEMGWQPGEDGSIVGSVIRTLTNPMVILGAALAYKYPVGAAREVLKKATGALKGYDRMLPPVIHRLMGPRGIFGKTKFLHYLEGFAADSNHFKAAVTSKAGAGLDKFIARMGRAPTQAEQVAASMVSEGLVQNSAHPSWQLVRRLARKEMYLEKYRSSMDTGKINRLIRDAINAEKKGLMGGDLDIEKKLRLVGSVTQRDYLMKLAPPELVESGKESLMDGLRMMVQGRNVQRLTDVKQVRRLISDKGMEKILEVRQATPAQLLDMAHKKGLDLPSVPLEKKAQAAFFKDLKAKLEFGYREGYWPHSTHRTPAQQEEFVRMMYEQTAAERQGMLLSGLEPVSPRAKAFRNATIPDATDFEFVSQGFSPETAEVLRYLKKIPETKLVNGEIVTTGASKYKTYSLYWSAVMENYGNSMASTYAWSARGWGPKLIQEVEGPMWVASQKSAAGRLRYHIAKENVLPVALGKLSQTEAMYALQWGGMKKQAFDFFTEMAKSNKWGLGRESQWLADQLARPEMRDLTFKNAGAKLAGYLYLSALGLNPASAGLNLFQNITHTTGLVPFPYVAKGMREASKGMPTFLKKVGSGTKIEQAFLEAWPEYLKLGGSSSEVSEMLRRVRMGAGGVASASRIEQAKKLVMGMFSGSERFNKLTAYHAGRLWGLGEKLPAWQAERVGMEIMNRTQFPGGFLSQSIMMQGWWPPFRQFTQFPARTLELFTSSPGTMGRMMATAGVAHEAGRAMGVDLSRAMVFGAMPQPMGEDQPFFPMPFMPPLLGVIGGVGSDLFSGEAGFTNTRRNLPLAMPGGVALARVNQVYGSPAVAKMIGRGYADYRNPRADGTIPVYTADGSLREFQSPVGLFKKAVGWNTLMGDQEADLTSYLVTQRDRIRNYRRSYVEALAANDMTRASTIHGEYKRAYPQLGDIVVKPSDIRAVHLRHDVTRLERVLETMPQDARELFGGMVGVAMGEIGDQTLGMDPAMLTRQPTIAKRDPYRRVPRGEQASRVAQQIGGGEEEDRPRIRMDQTGSIGGGGQFSAFAPFNVFGN